MVVHPPTPARAEDGKAAATAPSAGTEAAKAAPKPAVRFAMRNEQVVLPPAVRDMVDAILFATHSGDIADLAVAIDWNEMPPIFTPGKSEPAEEGTAGLLQHLRTVSKDGQGVEMLAVLANLLSVGPAQQPLGRDVENNAVYVWPYLAELEIARLTPPQLVDLYRLVPADRIAEMRAANRWSWYRLVIGADGTWHSFMPHR
jgi:hypothetical protein